MTEKRIFALLGFLFGLVAGLLILVDAVQLRGILDLERIATVAVQVLIGTAVLFASLLIYRSTTNMGGFVNLIVGIVGLFALALSIGTTASVLAIVSGILGLIASGTLR